MIKQLRSVCKTHSGAVSYMFRQRKHSCEYAWGERERGGYDPLAIIERSGSTRAEGAAPEKGLPFGSPFSGASDENKFEPVSESKPGEAGPIRERKKDSADVQFSRFLRKPRKRNRAESF